MYMSIYAGDRKLALRWVVCPACVHDVVSEWAGSCFYRDPIGYWNPVPPSADYDALYAAQEARQLPWDNKQGSQVIPHK